MEATHFEVLSSFALPSALRRQRDSYLSLENLESLTSELAEATLDLQRLEEGPAQPTVSSGHSPMPTRAALPKFGVPGKAWRRGPSRRLRWGWLTCCPVP